MKFNIAVTLLISSSQAIRGVEEKPSLPIQPTEYDEGQVRKREWNRLGNNLAQGPEEKKPLPIQSTEWDEGQVKKREWNRLGNNLAQGPTEKPSLPIQPTEYDEGQVRKRSWNRLGNNLAQGPEEKPSLPIQPTEYDEGQVRKRSWNRLGNNLAQGPTEKPSLPIQPTEYDEGQVRKRSWNRLGNNLSQGPEVKPALTIPSNEWSEGQVVKREWNRLGNNLVQDPSTGAIIAICNGLNAGKCVTAEEVNTKRYRRPHKRAMEGDEDYPAQEEQDKQNGIVFKEKESAKGSLAQLKHQHHAQILNYQNIIHGPQDLAQLTFSRDYRPFKKTQIYDEDGDGVEDNLKLTHDQLDKFYKPNVYGAPIEHIFNTRNGNLPEERNKAFYDAQTEPHTDYNSVSPSWEKVHSGLGERVAEFKN